MVVVVIGDMHTCGVKARTQAQTHRQTHRGTGTHTLTHTLTHTHSHSLTLTHTHTHTGPHRPTHTHTHTHTHRHADPLTIVSCAVVGVLLLQCRAGAVTKDAKAIVDGHHHHVANLRQRGTVVDDEARPPCIAWQTCAGEEEGGVGGEG